MLNAVTAKMTRTLRTGSQAGFSLPELLISITIFLIVSGVVTQALLQMTNSQRTIWNRTQMHSGVRSATELLQQEVGQAGRISLPYTTTLATAVVSGTQTVGVKQQIAALPAAAVASVKGIFVGEQLTIDAGEDALGNDLQETVAVTAVDTAGNTITATFVHNHAVAPVPVMVLGGFANGIVPLQPAFPNGSTPTLLKLFGDINGDGNMVYVEYKCDTAGGNLYRNVMPYDAAAKAAPTSSQILLNNIQANPDGTGCFTFEPNPLPGPFLINLVNYNFVLDVAITLTVKTQNKDPVTNLFQLETKALLNVSPRNVFNVWQLASAGITTRVQPTPPNILNNLLIG
jgi:prepilin-type N-terminal cleavage/methylation domain-containing protein